LEALKEADFLANDVFHVHLLAAFIYACPIDVSAAF
jgi:hypothetical protein